MYAYYIHACEIKGIAMMIVEHSVITKASREALWALYENSATWPIWDDGIESVSLHGPFVVGTKGTLKPAGGPEVVFEMVSVKRLHSFTDVSYLPLTKLIFTHAVDEQPDGQLKVTHRVAMEGLLSPLFAFVIGRKIKAGLPLAMKKLVALAESNPIV